METFDEFCTNGRGGGGGERRDASENASESRNYVSVSPDAAVSDRRYGIVNVFR